MSGGPREVERSWLEITPEVRLPLLRMGNGTGPVLAITAGVHGDEYEGVRAIFECFGELAGRALRGTVLAVPVVNPPAHWACERLSPVDGLNLAREFPGRAEGTVSERIAWHLTEDVIARADFYLDLHSGGVRYGMPSMAGYAAFDERGRAAAEVFGAPVIWGHPVIEPGRTISAALQRGIPFLYTEAWGAGRMAAADVAMMRRGIFNVMRHLVMLDGEPEIPAPPRRLWGAGNTDDGITAGRDGFLLLDVCLLDRVRAGQRLGRLADLHGETVEEYLAPRAATVGLTREMPAVRKGDTLFLLAEEE